MAGVRLQPSDFPLTHLRLSILWRRSAVVTHPQPRIVVLSQFVLGVFGDSGFSVPSKTTLTWPRVQGCGGCFWTPVISEVVPYVKPR